MLRRHYSPFIMEFAAAGTIRIHSISSAAGNKIWIVLVPFIDNYHFHLWPVYAKSGITPAHAAATLRKVRRRHLIEDFRLILERLEAVSKILRDVKHSPVAGG